MKQPELIVALDLSSAGDAMRLADSLAGSADFYKVGNELFTAAGPAIVEFLRARGSRVFLDLKFHDIPNTVAKGCASAARLGARLVTVHASAGVEALAAGVESAGECRVMAVTVLTSHDAKTLASALGRKSVKVADEVLRLAEVAAIAGAAGVVCSGKEVAAVKARFGNSLEVLVPGVRPAGTRASDQRRVATPREAASAGADYLVIGRAITEADDPAAALTRVVTELSAPE